jgi:hypothetical protein
MVEPTNSLIRLLIVHFTLTFLFSLQSGNEVEKSSHWRTANLWAFAIIYAVVMYVTAFNFEALLLMPLFFMVFVIINGILGINPPRFQALVFSHLFHLVFIMVLWALLLVPGVTAIGPFFSRSVIPFFRKYIFESRNTLLVTLGYILIFWPFGPLIGLLTKPWHQQFETDDRQGIENPGLARTGLWLGCLERFLIYSFILTDDLAAIGFLVAVKLIFRSGEIKEAKNSRKADYILIGSLLSFSTASLIGYMIKSWLVK